MKILTTKEYVALGEYLSEYPENMSFEEITQLMYESEISFPDEIEPCEYFEDWNPAALANRIDELLTTLEGHF